MKFFEYWKKGKKEMNKFYSLKFTRKTNVKTFLAGLLFAAIIVLPVAMLMIQFFMASSYGFNNERWKFYLFALMLVVLLMLANGFSNFFTIKIAKSYVSEMIPLQDIDEKAVLLYQCLNPGFLIFGIIVIFLYVWAFL